MSEPRNKLITEFTVRIERAYNAGETIDEPPDMIGAPYIKVRVFNKDQYVSDTFEQGKTIEDMTKDVVDFFFKMVAKNAKEPANGPK